MAPRRGRGLFLIAASEPAPGKTKTRLGATDRHGTRGRPYAAFLVDLAARFTPCPDGRLGFDVGWAYTPAEVDFRRCAARIGCARRRPRSASWRSMATAGTCGRRTCCAGARARLRANRADRLRLAATAVRHRAAAFAALERTM